MTSIWILLPPLTRGQYFMNICIGCKLWGAPSVGFLAKPPWAYLHFNHKCINNQSTATEISDHSSTCSLSKNVCHWGGRNAFFSFVWAISHKSGFTFKPSWCGGGKKRLPALSEVLTWDYTESCESACAHIPFGVAPSLSPQGESQRSGVDRHHAEHTGYYKRTKKTKRLPGTWCGQMSWVCCCWHFIKAMWVCVIILMLINLFDEYYNWEFQGKTFHTPMLLHSCKQTSWRVKELQQVGVKNRLHAQPGKFIPGCCYHCIIVFVNHILGSIF